jgi:hypothetical protein
MIHNISAWWLLGTAALLMSPWVVRVFGASIDTQIFAKVVQRLLREKNLTRAIKLSIAAGDAPVATATKAALLASVSREEDEKRPAGYRGSRPVSIDVVRARIRARYDEAFNKPSAPLQHVFLLALLSAFLFVLVLVRKLSLPELDWVVIGVAGAGQLFWFYVAWTHTKILSSRNAAFELLWPSFEAVYHDRHSLSLEDKPVVYSGLATPPDPPASEPMKPRITLEVLEPGKPLRSVPLDRPVIKIGKLATSHVQLSAEGVARMHAVIEIADGKASIIDLGATKQTRVNLQPVNKCELSNGDVIGIGDAEMVVRLDAGGDSQP